MSAKVGGSQTRIRRRQIVAQRKEDEKMFQRIE